MTTPLHLEDLERTANAFPHLLTMRNYVAALSKGVVPAGTDKCTKWALANFAAWKKAMNKKHPDDPVPADIFTCNDPATLNTHISRFVLETRK